MPSSLRLLCLGLLIAGNTGCGALVDGHWPGEPLLTFTGNVFLNDTPALDTLDVSQLKPTVSFIDPSGSPTGAGTFDLRDVTSFTSFPARYSIHVYQPPPEEAKFVTPWDPQGPRIAVALPLLYIDENEDGAWNPGQERIVGGSVDVVGVWSAASVEVENWDTAGLWDTGAAESSSAESDVLQVPFQEGYQRFSADLSWCGDRTDVPTSRIDLFPPNTAGVDMFVGQAFRDLTSWGCWDSP